MMTWTLEELATLLKRAASSLENVPSAATYRSETEGKSGSDSKGKGSSVVISSDAHEAISLKLKLVAVEAVKEMILLT